MPLVLLLFSSQSCQFHHQLLFVVLAAFLGPQQLLHVEGRGLKLSKEEDLDATAHRFAPALRRPWLLGSPSFDVVVVLLERCRADRFAASFILHVYK